MEARGLKASERVHISTDFNLSQREKEAKIKTEKEKQITKEKKGKREKEKKREREKEKDKGEKGVVDRSWSEWIRTDRMKM